MAIIIFEFILLFNASGITIFFFFFFFFFKKFFKEKNDFDETNEFYKMISNFKRSDSTQKYRTNIVQRINFALCFIVSWQVSYYPDSNVTQFRFVIAAPICYSNISILI